MTTPDEPRPPASEQPRARSVEEPAERRSKKRRWKPLLIELLLWAALAVATAAFLVYASERWLPANF